VALVSVSPAQDDAHIFCLPSQMRDEIRGVLDLTEAILNDFGLRGWRSIVDAPREERGQQAVWEQATQALRDAPGGQGVGVPGGRGGTFYGPRVDVKIEDAIGRKWQCSTIQVSHGGHCSRVYSIWSWVRYSALLYVCSSLYDSAMGKVCSSVR